MFFESIGAAFAIAPCLDLRQCCSHLMCELFAFQVLGHGDIVVKSALVRQNTLKELFEVLKDLHPPQQLRLLGLLKNLSSEPNMLDPLQVCPSKNF